METRTLKTIHFFLCWVYTIISGIIIGAFFDPMLSVLIAMVAIICSSPFLVMFLIGIHNYLKGNRTKSNLHLFVFLLHFIGTILTLAVLSIQIREMGFLLAVIGGYFIIDSIFFHTTIERRYSGNSRNQFYVGNSEILDEI